MLSGGSFASTSVTCEESTRTLQDSFAVKLTSGSMVKVVPLPDDVAACTPLDAHVIANQLPDVLTGSLNVTEMFASRGTPVAFGAGVLELTLGAASPAPLLRGSGGPPMKSAPLLSVSWLPPFCRKIAVVAVGDGAV